MSVSNAIAKPVRVKRPTRDEVRRRLLDAAAEALVLHGYGAASVDTITEAAGLSRGALYSNFTDKEDLYLALLDELEHAQVAELSALYAQSLTVDDFLVSVANRGAADRDPRGVLILQTELWLLGTRNENVRKRLASIQRHSAKAIARVIGGPKLGFTAEELGAVVLALGDGLLTRRIVDPHSHRAGLLVDMLRSLATFAGLNPAAS